MKTRIQEVLRPIILEIHKVEQGRGSRILSELLKRVSLVRAAIIGEVSVFIL